MDQVERSAQLISNDFDKQKVVFSKFKTELDTISKQIKSGGTHSVDGIGETLDVIRKENTKLKSELIDVQMRSMRNNLIFYNIPESEGEQCTHIINKFCVKNLKIENVDTKLSIAEAYRLGKHGEKTRPILVKFSNFESRDLVKKSAKNLKDTCFGISEQLPLDIQKRRKEKLPILKDLRERDIKAYFVKDLYKDNDFLNLINDYNILFLSETWLKDNNLLVIDGFDRISCVFRNKNIGTRNEGGIAVFCKSFLCNGIIVEKELNDGIILLKLDHSFFDTDKDIFICFSYVPHERSNYYQLCDIDFHDIIESIVNNYSDKGIVLVCGDLNSRIGELSDFLLNDDLDKYVESVEHVVNPIISDRSSMDKTVNAFGRKLLQMCFNTGLVVANGRLCNDKNGNFTFCTAKGRSVNDYLLVPRANVD
ncbi:Hypothetical predicted protein [Mytilus galloprovincialis]|uniref:Endonuclease/exonuclease/phosphatase domain-containing protein n=1 Tax=Mytilus galloprovincialis TaxID=29158 RepID=A0A8B6FCF9_MYTGA|nr:Hypothetical predicted protein [Mytilus galloprovincialis]